MSQPPHNPEIEAGLLGAVLLLDKPMGALLSIEGVRPETFYRPLHQRIFAAATELHRAGDRVDAATVCDALARHPGWADDMGSAVHTLATLAPAPGAWRTYARRLVELARLRDQQEAGIQLAAAAEAQDAEGVAAALERLSAIDQQVTLRRRPSREERQEAVLAIAEGKGTVWRTPFRRLNVLLAGGMRPGQFTTLAGWASHGKSVLAVQLLNHFAGQGARCALYTNEMETDELDLRDTARESGVPHWRLAQGNVRPDEWDGLAKAIERIGEAFPVVEAAGMTADEVAYDIRRERWDVAVVDLLNGMPGSEKTEGVDRNMATLAACCRQSSAHIIACQHLNQARHVGRAYPPEPAPADIRQSGAIYNLSNNVLFVHLKESETEPGEPSTNGVLRLAKARGGMRGQLDVTFQPDKMRFLPPLGDGQVGVVAA